MHQSKHAKCCWILQYHWIKAACTPWAVFLEALAGTVTEPNRPAVAAAAAAAAASAAVRVLATPLILAFGFGFAANVAAASLG